MSQVISYPLPISGLLTRVRAKLEAENYSSQTIKAYLGQHSGGASEPGALSRGHCRFCPRRCVDLFAGSGINAHFMGDGRVRRGADAGRPCHHTPNIGGEYWTASGRGHVRGVIRR